MGMVLPKAPPRAATVALLMSPLAYGLLTVVLDVFFDSQAHLNAAAGAFVLSSLAMVVGSRVRPLEEARPLPQSDAVDLEPAASARWAGAVVVILTVGLYAVFWIGVGAPARESRPPAQVRNLTTWVPKARSRFLRGRGCGRSGRCPPSRFRG